MPCCRPTGWDVGPGVLVGQRPTYVPSLPHRRLATVGNRVSQPGGLYDRNASGGDNCRPAGTHVRHCWSTTRLACGRFASWTRPPVVPAPVVVEGRRGDAQMARLLAGCEVDELDEPTARAAGRLLGSCAITVEATDAVVVEGALRRHQAVVTSNRDHLEALADGVARRIGIIDIS